MLREATHVTSTFLGLHLSGSLTAGDVIVGGATALLALFAYLNIRLARRTLEAQDAPLLVASVIDPGDTLGTKLRLTEPYIGVLPDGFSPRFVMRLVNTGRGPAVVLDIRLKLGSFEVLAAGKRQEVVNANSYRDLSWTDVGIAKEQLDATLDGHLDVLYAHPNGTVLRTRSQVDLFKRRLYVRTILRTQRRFWQAKPRPIVLKLGAVDPIAALDVHLGAGQEVGQTSVHDSTGVAALSEPPRPQ